MPVAPAIDYTNKDFASLRQALLDLARSRLPEWTDRSPADLGMLLVDLFAYVGDVMLYYQDRIANESFLQTATERRSVLQMLRLIGYELKPPIAAAADLDLVFKPLPSGSTPLVVIPQGAQFLASSAAGPRSFEYVGLDLSIDLTSAQVQPIDGGGGKSVYRALPVRQSTTLPTEVIGSSTGEANQAFPLRHSPLILDSILVEVNEGAGWVAWDRRDDLLYYVGPDGRVTVAGPESRDYYVRYDENDGATVYFGDGVYGARPPAGANNIRATYRIGGGSAGNVPAGAINQAAQALKTAVPLLDSVSNPLGAAGGADRETIDHATRFGPLAFRSGQRAVTLSDFESLAQQIGGVAKVRGVSRDWNHVDLYIAPESSACGPVPEDLRTRIIAAFEEKRMVTSIIRVLDATCIPIDIAMDVVFDRHFRVDAVRQSVDAAVRGLLAFRNVDFGRPVYLSSVYGAVEVLPGVTALTVTTFGRQASLAAGGASLDIGLGRIDIGDFEIPSLGNLTINMLENRR